MLGSATARLNLNSVLTNAAGDYTVVISNSFGSTTSTAATLTLAAPPTITTQPTSKTVAPGLVASLSVVASGTGLSYQWVKDGNTLIGATSSTLDFNNAQSADTGSYVVVVSNGSGKATSSAALLAIPVKPVVNPLALLDARVGENYLKQVTATNNPTKFTIDGLPAGLTYDTATGFISGHPTAAGTATVRVTAANAAGLHFDQDLALTRRWLGKVEVVIKLGGGGEDERFHGNADHAASVSGGKE